jgi:hypothetical protein
MKIIMTDEVMDVAPGVMMFTTERLAEIVEFARSGASLPRSWVPPGQAGVCRQCGDTGRAEPTLEYPDGETCTCEVSALRTRAEAAEKALAEARPLLKEVQFDNFSTMDNQMCCSVCGGRQDKGHYSDCRLAALIAEPPKGTLRNE